MRKVSMAIVALLLGAFGLALVASPSQATEDDECPTWVLHSTITGIDWEDDEAAGSVVVDGNTVKLTKPIGGGTEFATDDVGIELSNTADITVNYTLSTEASLAAGAVRLFYYNATGVNTLIAAPTGFVAAIDGDGGTLTLPASGHVGALGVVYDASNASAGTVTFTGLKVGDIPISFTGDACQTEPTTPPTPDPDPTTPEPAPPTPTTGPTTPPPPSSPPAADPKDCEAYETKTGTDLCEYTEENGDALNCEDISDADRPVKVLVVGTDPFDLDRDGDGVGCELDPGQGGSDPTTNPPGGGLALTGGKGNPVPIITGAGAALVAIGALMLWFLRQRRKEEDAAELA